MLLTPADLDRLSAAAARALLAGGVRAGERVGLRGAQDTRYLSALLGLVRIGAIAAPLSTRVPAGAIPGLLARVGAGALVSGEGAGALEGVRCLPFPRTDAAPGGAVVPPFGAFGDGAPATLVFTSGSTGAPKAALHTAGNHAWSARGANAHVLFGPGDGWLLALPLYHVGGLGVLFRCLEAGANVVLPEMGEPLAVSLARPGVTHVSLVATQLARALREAPEALDGKRILLGGSAISPTLLDDAHSRGLAVLTSYGLTEAASLVTATAPGAPRADLATSGRVLAHRELRVSARGEIEIRGRTRFAGYLTADGLATPFDADGWFATGDTGALDAEGRLVVAGRRDAMFVSGGENVQPEAIERALVALPGVREALVVPVEDAAFGHRPFAFVDADGGLDGPRLNALLAEHLPGFMLPVGYGAWAAPGGLKPSRADAARRAALIPRLR